MKANCAGVRQESDGTETHLHTKDHWPQVPTSWRRTQENRKNVKSRSVPSVSYSIYYYYLKMLRKFTRKRIWSVTGNNKESSAFRVRFSFVNCSTRCCQSCWLPIRQMSVVLVLSHTHKHQFTLKCILFFFFIHLQWQLSYVHTVECFTLI